MERIYLLSAATGSGVGKNQTKTKSSRAKQKIDEIKPVVEQQIRI